MPTYYDPHLYIRFQAKAVIDPDADVPQVEAEQSLGRTYNLGPYTVAELEDLQNKLENKLETWVAENPPHGNGA